MANPTFVGKAAAAAGIDPNSAGFKAMRSELELASKVLNEGMLAGVFALATGSGKVRAIWEGIKWSTIARAGAGGFLFMLGAANALAFGIRKIVTDTGALQAAMNRLEISRQLTRNFEALLGSVSAAKARVSELYAYSATSRFDFEDIAAASKALTAFSNGAMGGATDLERLGRISMATSTPIQDLAGAVGQTANAIRNGMNFSGSLEQLRQMGVVSEGTVKRLEGMAAQGASTASVLDAFNASIQKTSENLGESQKTVADYEAQAGKAREALAAAFGAPFVEYHRREVELTGKVYENFTGVAGKLGRMMADLTSPFDRIRMTAKEIGASKGFADLASQITMVAAAAIPVTAAFATVKGLATLLKSTYREFRAGGIEGVMDIAKGVVSPAARSRDWLARAYRMEKAGAPEIAVKGADLMATMWSKVGTVIEFVVAQSSRLLPLLARIAVPVAGILAVAYVGERIWERYNEEIDKAKRLTDMSDSIKKDTAAMQEQAAAMKTRDDYLQLLTDAQNRYNAALAEEATIQANPKLTDDDRHAAAAKVAVAAKDLRRVQGMDTSNLGMSKDEIATAMRRYQIEKQINDIVFEARVARASDGEKALLLAQRRMDYEERAAEYRKSEAAAGDIAARRTTYEGAGATDEAAIKSAQAEVKRLQEEYSKARPGAFSPEHVASSTAARREQQLRQDLDDAQQRLAEASLGPNKEKARAEYLAALRRGGRGDRLEAEAVELEAAPGDNRGRISAIRNEAIRQRVIDSAEAEQRAAELRAASFSHMRQMAQTTIGQAFQQQALGVTSESYQGQDTLARQRIQENLEALAEATKNYHEDKNNVEATLAHKQQVEAIRLENAQIQKEIDERARTLDREMVAWKSAIDAHNKNNEAITAAASGHYGVAAAALREAREIEDRQAQASRTVELRGQGFSEADTKRMVTEEQRQREADRRTRADAFRTTETRRATELELENAARGRGTAGGLSGPAARLQLKQMQDVDAFREQLGKNLAELGPDHAEEAAKLAFRTTAASIMAQGGQPQGAGSMGDSLTAVGGGGGFYAGATGDPQLAALNRIAKLAEDQNKILAEIKDKKVVVK